jgi:Ca-activated chloride channel family protein
MWRPMAEAMGWPQKQIGWTEIMELANDSEGWGRYGHPEWGRFKFGHTHPLESNTGRLAIASVAYWALGMKDGLTPELAKSAPVVDAIRQLEAHTEHYGGSTRQLFARMAQLGPGYLSAGTTSETNLVVTNQLNEDLPNREPPWNEFAFIVPAEGAFWSDNPYCVLSADWVSPQQREAAEVYKEFLLDDEQQRIAMEVHGLRPTSPNVALGPLIDLESGTDPADTPGNIPTYQPIDGPTANALDDVFIAEKRKAIIVVLLDTSASMTGQPLDGAKAATVEFLSALKEKDPDDEVYVVPFNSQVTPLTPGGRLGDVVETTGELEQKVQSLFADGGTALYDAVCQGAVLAEQRQESHSQSDQERLAGLIVLSDGADTSSEAHTESDVFNFCVPDPDDPTKNEPGKNIPVYTIAYGEAANRNFLIQLANYSHGRFYTLDETTLDEIYSFIAFEQ